MPKDSEHLSRAALAFWAVLPPAAPVATVFEPEDPICTGAQDARIRDKKISKAVLIVSSIFEFSVIINHIYFIKNSSIRIPIDRNLSMKNPGNLSETRALARDDTIPLSGIQNFILQLFDCSFFKKVEQSVPKNREMI